MLAFFFLVLSFLRILGGASFSIMEVALEEAVKINGSGPAVCEGIGLTIAGVGDVLQGYEVARVDKAVEADEVEVPAFDAEVV